MAEEISSPLLTPHPENGLIDDLQYEEVAGELKRSGTPVIQVLQDFGIMKLDDILQVMADASGHGGRFAAATGKFTPELLQTDSGQGGAACITACRSALHDGTVQVALADPLDPGAAGRNSFCRQADVQIVVADPAEIRKGD